MTFTDVLVSVTTDFSDYLKGKSEINADVFINPNKYALRLPIGRIVADSKVSRQGIEIYKQKIAKNQKIKPIIVVKHPKKVLYAILDGHHRYYALREMGIKEVNCALAGNCSSAIFYLTEHGYFQPTAEITESIRQPIIKLHKNLIQSLMKFADPEI